MKLWHLFRPKTGKEIPFLILISFLATFAVSRLIVNYFPDLFLQVRGTHVHHFAYGVVLLVLLCYFLLTQPRSSRTRLKLSLIYGVALGLAFTNSVCGFNWKMSIIIAHPTMLLLLFQQYS